MEIIYKKRLFIALNLPSQIKNEIVFLINQLQKPNNGIKWVNPQGLHLTLHFLGYLDETQIEQVKLTMQSLEGKFHGFQFKTGKINAFPNLFNPRVIFLACEQINGNSVFKLQELLGEKLIQLGITIDKRPWQVHITLGRVKGESGEKLSIANLLQKDFTISSFELMESILKPTGAEYKEIFSCQL